MKANAHIREYHKWMINNRAEHHISAWRNFKYREQCTAERQRRREAGLIITSYHAQDKGHAECQDEFISWFHKQFGYSMEGSNTPMLFWDHGGGTGIGTNSHHWLVENTHQQMLAKLRWQ